MTSTAAVFGPPGALLELSTQSARLLPRLKLVTQLKDYVASDSQELSALSPTLVLWKCLTQGIPLLVLLDLFEQHVVAQDSQALHHWIKRGSYETSSRGELLAEYNRRVDILFLRGQLSEKSNVSVKDVLAGSAKELLKLVKFVLQTVRVLATQSPNFYNVPSDSPMLRCKTLISFIESENAFVARLKEAKDRLSELLRTPTSEAVQYRGVLRVQFNNIRQICIYHDYVSSCLEGFLTGGEHWDDLFDVADYKYAKATEAYKYYCDAYLEFRVLLNGLKDKWQDAFHSGALEALRDIEGPIHHLRTFAKYLSEVISFSDPIDGLYEYDSLCVVFSTWSSWVQTIFEAMKVRRSLHVGDELIRRAFFWDWEHPSTFGDYLIDDSLFVTMSLNMRGQFRRSPSTKNVCFVFLFKALLLICRPRNVDREEDVKSTFPIASWDVGPALRSNSIFSVQSLIATDSITHIHRHISANTLVITWAVGNFGSETLTLHFVGLQQLKQWTEVMQRACPNSQLFGWESFNSNMGSRTSSTKRRGGIEKDRKDRLPIQQRSLDVSSLEPLGTASRRIKSETHLFTLLEWFLRPAESRWHELRDYPTPRIGRARRRSNARVTHDWDVLQPSKSYWIRGVQTAPSSDAVPDLTGQVDKTQSTPTQRGGFATVWKCNWNSRVGTIEVAVKVLNQRGWLDREEEEKRKKRLDHELTIWLRLEHENVVPLLGICRNFDSEPFVAMVSPWYENGNLHDFVATHSEELRLGERMGLLSEIAAGLSYLHSEKIVHGDLHSANVLINRHGTACIADFGLSRLVKENVVSYLESIEGGACRWAAPEFRCSFASDIYAYGCIILEVLSGKLPYYNLKNNQLVIMELSNKRKPLRPPNDLPYLTDGIWSFANECWDDPPINRPSASDVKSRMLLLFYRSLGSHPI